MTDRHAAALSVVAASVLVALVAVRGGVGPALIAAVGLLALVVAMGFGLPALVVVAALAQVGAVGWLVGAGDSWSGVVLAAPALWVSAEAGWRSLDLRPAMRATRAATFAWSGMCVAVVVGTAAVAVLVSGAEGWAPAGGLTFRLLAVGAVVLAAGLVTASARRRPVR